MSLLSKWPDRRVVAVALIVTGGTATLLVKRRSPSPTGPERSDNRKAQTLQGVVSVVRHRGVPKSAEDGYRFGSHRPAHHSRGAGRSLTSGEVRALPSPPPGRSHLPPLWSSHAFGASMTLRSTPSTAR